MLKLDLKSLNEPQNVRIRECEFETDSLTNTNAKVGVSFDSIERSPLKAKQSGSNTRNSTV